MPGDLYERRGLATVVWVGVGGLLALALHGPLVMLLLTTLEQFPGLQEQLEKLKRLVEPLMSDTSLAGKLVVLALLPAVAEELMFRGFILSGLSTRLGVSKAIMVSSILFAFAHMSAFRFVPTFVLGIILAILAMRSGSLLPGVIFHSIHNGLLVLASSAATHQDEGWTALFDEHGLYSWPAVMAGVLVACLIMLGLFRRSAPPPDNPAKAGE